MMHIDILLATYNGADYVAEQIESILSQTHTDWSLIVRDDGSSDATLAILSQYRAAHPQRIFLIQDGKRLGAKNSFAALMQHSSAPYIAFSDQDDVWHVDKLERLLSEIQACEREAGAHMPILAHSDLEVVDLHLQQLAPSFWAYQGINPGRDSLAQLLCINTVTGCSMMINRALLNMAVPVPSDAYMHDYWLALVAALAGRIVVLPAALLKYRQHSSNTLGAIAARPLFSLPRKKFTVKSWRTGFYASSTQATALYRAYSGKISDSVLMPAQILAELNRRSWLVRRWQLLRYGFLKVRLRLLVAILLLA